MKSPLLRKIVGYVVSKDGGYVPYFEFDYEDYEEYQDFLNGEVRYLSLKKSNPAHAEEMYAANAQNAKDHLNYLQRLEKLYDPAQQ